jgi:uncharacterized membrane protein
LQIFLLLALPGLAIILAQNFRFCAWLSPVILCYLLGMVLGNLYYWKPDTAITTTMNEITVVLAIPLLLFSSDFLSWSRLAKKTVLSFALAALAVIASALCLSPFFAHRVDEHWKIAGMLVSTFIGGTPNMSAVGMALEVSKENFILVSGAEMVASTTYLIFLMTFAQRLLLLFMPAFKQTPKRPAPEAELEPKTFHLLRKKDQLKSLALGLGLALMITLLSIGFSWIFWHKVVVTVVILSITTLALAASFSSKIRNIAGTYDIGQYLLLIFFVGIGSLADINKILQTQGIIFYYCGTVLLGAVLLHFTLAAFFKIDADTVLITSTAAIFSPAFVGTIAAVLKNREVVVSGVLSGLIGYAIANYVGVVVAVLLRP